MGIVYIESHEELVRMQKEFEKGVKKEEPKIKRNSNYVGRKSI